MSVIRTVSLPPKPGRVANGLRDTGYDFNTSIADIVDNSIAAEATQIDISINTTPDNEITIYIADNGNGMDEAGLENAMVYGSKERDDPHSLGKFGLGLKTSSTAFCRCLSVVSKEEKTKSINKAQWDLDYIEKTDDWGLNFLEPTQDDIDMLEATAPDSHGTLVIWEKVDRLVKNNSRSSFQSTIKKITSNLIFHLSMVFQRFLDENDSRCRNINITVNTIKLTAWDPFCVREKNTTCLIDESIDIQIDEKQEFSILLKAYVLPRKENFSTTESMKIASISNDKQGFYIYRENRLIDFGHWLGISTNEPHISLLRVQFDFDSNLDSLFNVDIKKSKISIGEELKDALEKLLRPARREADLRYRKGVIDAVNKKTTDAHEASNRNIDEKASDKTSGLEKSKVTVTGKNEVQIENVHGKFLHKIDVRTSEKTGQLRIIPVDNIDDGLLWDPCIVDNKNAVKINKSHPYYQKVYYPVIEQNVMVTGMDALLWALGEAEFDSFTDEAKEQFFDLRAMVSSKLRKLVADLPEPDPDSQID